MADKKVIDEEKKVERLEKKILQEEGKIESELNSSKVKDLVKDEGIMTSLHVIRHVFIDKIAKHKFLFTVIVITGVVLVWRGIWEVTASLPILSISSIALLTGLLILWLVEKYTNLN